MGMGKRNKPNVGSMIQVVFTSLLTMHTRCLELTGVRSWDFRDEWGFCSNLGASEKIAKGLLNWIRKEGQQYSVFETLKHPKQLLQRQVHLLPMNNTVGSWLSFSVFFFIAKPKQFNAGSAKKLYICSNSYMIWSQMFCDKLCKMV